MRKINDKLKDSLAADVTNFVTCIKVQLKNGIVQGFTDHVEDIVTKGVKYESNAGFVSSAIENSSSLSVDNLEVSGFIDSDKIKSADIEQGRYDHAYVEVFIVDYTSLHSGIILLKSGHIGEVKQLNNKFVAEVRGISEKFSTNIGKLYSPTCRAVFCGPECKFDKNKTIKHSIVINVIDKFTIECRDLEIHDNFYHMGGSIRFTTGQNIDLSSSVRECKNTKVVFLNDFPHEVMIGDKFALYGGCDKKFETCCNTYNNAINFRGEPHLPGMDEILKTAGTFK